MKPASLRLALLLSVALNLGVIGAVTLDRLRPPANTSKPALHQVLGLNAASAVLIDRMGGAAEARATDGA